MRMNAPVIEIEGLNFGYESGPVLSDVALRIRQGDFIAIVGPNGGGKTTLLRLIQGLLRPQSGRIRIFGKDPGDEPARIGYVPQHSNLAPGFPATAEEVVLMGLPHGRRHGPRFWRDERTRAREAMRRAGVEDLAGKRLPELSGGQRQRVLIARALITRPELLLLDEPLSNIDPYGRQCIVETLTGLGRETTIVMVSHDLGITANAVTGLAAVNRYLVQTGGPQLTPAMLELMYGVHEAGCPVYEHIHNLAETLPSGEVRA
jgi:zinc transport system ATP-binding protein